MPGPPTPNLGLSPPTVGGDLNVWGSELNGNLAILDGLGSFSLFITSSNLTPPVGVFPETIILGSGGALGININLPVPPAGRFVKFTVKKRDATAGIVTVVALTGTIDGFATYRLVNQFQYVILLWDGANWNIVGNN